MLAFSLYLPLEIVLDSREEVKPCAAFYLVDCHEGFTLFLLALVVPEVIGSRAHMAFPHGQYSLEESLRHIY